MAESQFQKRVRKIVQELLGCTIKSEVNARKLFPDYPASNEHYDIVINLYKVIIECHGEHHSQPVAYGGDAVEAALKLAPQKHRDRRKEEAVWENGWGYICIWRNELPKDDSDARKFIMNKILEAIKKRED